jgi:hypothetical protein
LSRYQPCRVRIFNRGAIRANPHSGRQRIARKGSVAFGRESRKEFTENLGRRRPSSKTAHVGITDSTASKMATTGPGTPRPAIRAGRLSPTCTVAPDVTTECRQAARQTRTASCRNGLCTRCRMCGRVAS